MHVTRGHQSSTRREWTVKARDREYRATCSWSVGSLRMEWVVEVYISPPQHTSYWRRVAGHDVIGAVREFENNFAVLTA